MMSMTKEQMSAIKCFLATGKMLDGSMVTDKWVEEQIRSCVTEIETLGQQLNDVEAILDDNADLELASKRVVRAWKKQADLTPHLKVLSEALKPAAKTETLPDES